MVRGRKSPSLIIKQQYNKMTIELRHYDPASIMRAREEQSVNYRTTHGNSTLVLFHIGAWFLAYGKNARDITEVTNLTLEHRNGRDFTEFPERKSDMYFPRLVRNGYKIAIFETT